MQRASLLIVLCFALFSCKEDSFYTKSFAFSHQVWNQDVKPVFKVDIQDTSILYDFVVTVRTSTDYAYNNLWVFLSTKPPHGQEVREPYEIKTTYPDGNWIGKKTGTIVEHELIFKRRKVPYKGIYTFTFEQAITMKKVAEILDISMEVKRAVE
jgi:gliding motility-associated lipoprotein GldH